MIRTSLQLFTCVFIITFLAGCSYNKQETLYTALNPNHSGIRFANTITENNADTTLISEFAYMGGGVGIGDFNNDGLKDIYFSGNQVSGKLYLNKGANRFEDITEKAGVSTSIWTTGVSIVDINADGFDDIYLCAFGKDLVTRAKNLLFINQGDLSFKEQAIEYGLADTSYSTQASFFDYDKDGDLDMYLLNYRLNGPNANSIYPKDLSGTSPGNDKLYRNDGDTLAKGHPYFTDVSMEAGIKEDGYGLGITISDFNGDNWPDVYVANDFLSNDELWLNNKNGTFTNCIRQAVKHQSYSSMGTDAADINNDGLPDITTLDMMPEYNERKKLQASFMNYERYERERQLDYDPEFVRNMLQLNNGTQFRSDTAFPFFSEIGQLAGISETDWSWSVLMADFNNDGWKDMHITNGIGRDYINADFVQFTAAKGEDFFDAEDRKALNNELISLKHVLLSNYLYINNHNYSFTDYSSKGGIDEKALSNGAAYADLDNDGDLDLVINNINREAFVFINNTINKESPVKAHFLRINLEGDALNQDAFGAKVFVYANNQIQMQEQLPVRGYLSSVDQTLVFGLGESQKVDSIVIVWPNDKTQTIKNITVDTVLGFSQKMATAHFVPAQQPPPALFTEATHAKNILYRQVEVPVNDYAQHRLLPQKFSQLGPFITSGDVNGDGLTDFFVGGAFNFSGALFLQQANGSFKRGRFKEESKMQEDADCILFDADGDSDKDLLITSGDTRYEEGSGYYRPRLFKNDGKGNFSLDTTAISPSVKTIAGCVREADFDGDGDLDVFIGGRVSKQYPVIPQSFLLQNNGGRFADITEKICPQLRNAGMITGAVWADIDKDKRPDLILAGEWMPLRIFKNKPNQLEEITNGVGLSDNNGMWRTITANDIDDDGDIDLIAGNLGQNCKYHVSPNEPMKVFAKDIDGNGSIDPVPFYYIRDDQNKRTLYPAVNRDQLADQVPSVKKKFLKHQQYAAAGLDDIFPDKKDLLELTCNEIRSCYFENLGNGKFSKHALPIEAQFAPVNSILCDDLDNDGRKDLLLAGNEYNTEVMTGRYDASFGLFLKGILPYGFVSVPAVKSGFLIHNDVRSMNIITTGNKRKLIIAGVNNDSLRVFQVNDNR